MATITPIGAKNFSYFQPILPSEPMGDSCFRMGLIDGARPVGAVEINKSDGLCEINSIYVPESERRRGYGKQLLDAVERLSKENGLFGLQADYSASKELSGFFEANNFFVVDGDTIYELPLEAFLKSPLLERYCSGKSGRTVFPYGMLTARQTLDMQALFERGGYDVYAAKELFPDDALSQICLDENGKIDGAFLISGTDARLVFALLITATKDNLSQIRALFTGFLDACKKDGRNFDTLAFYAENMRILELVEKIVPDKSVLTDKVLTQVAVKTVGEVAPEVPDENN